MEPLLFLIISVFASNEIETNTANSQPNILENSEQNVILVKIEEEEYAEKRSNYIGVSYNKSHSTWEPYRYSKNKKKTVHNGTYRDEETAAHASDTLARKLIANGEKHHRLNFPDDDTEVNAKETKRVNFIGVFYIKNVAKWSAQRYSKKEKKMVHNGTYKDEDTAAHASDTLARKLLANAEKGHRLNFPDDETKVNPETERVNFIGVFYNKKKARWSAQRYSKNDKNTVYNGNYKDKVTAAHASDTLARKLIANGEKGHRLNFPDDIEVNPKEYQSSKRKRDSSINSNEENDNNKY